MQLHDYTPLFQVEKKWRRIDNINIPEMSYRAAAWGGAAGVTATVLWFTVLGRVVGLLPLPTLFEFLLPAAFIIGSAWGFGKAATSRMRYGKELSELTRSWVAFRTSPHILVDFLPWKPDRTQAVLAEAVVATTAPVASTRRETWVR